MPSEDNIVESYKYAWTTSSETSIDEFVAKFKPSMVQDDGTKPYLWVQPKELEKSEDTNVEEATGEAKELVDDVVQRIEEIKNDSSIPTRASKKNKAKTKKEVREELQSESAEKLKEIAKRHGFTSGKWLIYSSRDKVDGLWTSIATSLVNGPLSSTCAYKARVTTCPADESKGQQHVIWVYVPDVFDEAAVKEVMRVLLQKHGATLTGAKANLYSACDIDSKHPSGISSTVWKNGQLMAEDEIKNLREEYFKGATGKVAAATTTTTTTGKAAERIIPDANVEKAPEGAGEASAKAPAKKLVKKKKKDELWSDDDEDKEDKRPAKKQKK